MRATVAITAVLAIIGAALLWGPEQANSQPAEEPQNRPESLEPVPDKQQEEEPDKSFTTYCAWMLLGQSNGIYYYDARNCGNCNFTTVGTSDWHWIDYDCQSQLCSAEITGCTDPINVNFRQTPPSGLGRYIPPRRPNGKPGDSADSDGRLFLSGVHIRHRKNNAGDFISDEVVRIRRGSGAPRLFRVFALHVVTGAGPHFATFGQELDPSSSPMVIADGRHDRQRTPHHHVGSATIRGVDLADIELITKEPWEP